MTSSANCCPPPHPHPPPLSAPPGGYFQLHLQICYTVSSSGSLIITIIQERLNTRLAVCYVWLDACSSFSLHRSGKGVLWSVSLVRALLSEHFQQKTLIYKSVWGLHSVASEESPRDLWSNTLLKNLSQLILTRVAKFQEFSKMETFHGN